MTELPVVGPDCRSTTGRCEFSTITASQLSTATIILAYVVIRIAGVVLAKNPDVDGIQLTIVSAATIVYIFLCLLLIEDTYIATLRSLRAHYRWMEFALRVVVLMAISILPTFLGLIPTLPSHAAPADRIAEFLIILYAVFLTWDAVVYFGAPSTGSPQRSHIQQIALRFLQTDGVGIALLIVAEGARYVNPAAAAVVLCIVIPFTFFVQIRRAFQDLVESRFSGGPVRDMLR